MSFENSSIRNPRAYRIKGFATNYSSQDSQVSTKAQEDARIMRKKIYSCCLCEFVGETVGLDNLWPLEKRKYLHHLKMAHGLER